MPHIFYSFVYAIKEFMGTILVISIICGMSIVPMKTSINEVDIILMWKRLQLRNIIILK